MNTPRHIGWLIAAAPLIFVVSWSTGNIFTKLGLPHAEPFTFLTIRFALATLLLAVIALVLRAPWPSSPRVVGHILVAGSLVYTVYLCAVFIAIDQGVSTGTAALISGLQPILTACVVGRVLVGLPTGGHRREQKKGSTEETSRGHHPEGLAGCHR